MAQNDWEDVTHQVAGGDWEDVTDQQIPRGQQVYRSPVGPNPKLSSGSFKQAAGDIVNRTAPGARTFIPQDRPEPVAGTPPMALPVGGALTQGIGAVDKLAQFLQASRGARLGASTAEGAIRGGLSDRSSALEGGLEGLATGLGSEAVAAAFGGAKGAWDRGRAVSKYAKDPVAAQDAAIDAIDKANGALRKSYQDKISPKLKEMTYDLETQKYAGSVPEADDLIRRTTIMQPGGSPPPRFQVTGEEGEGLRRALESEVKYPRQTNVAIPKEVADKYAANKALADDIRAQRRLGQDSELANLYDEWSNRIGMGEDLAAKSSRPITAITGQRGDDLALKARIDRAVGSDLTGLGERLGSAERIRNAKGFAAPALELGTQTFKGGLQGAKDSSGAGLESFIKMIMEKSRQ